MDGSPPDSVAPEHPPVPERHQLGVGIRPPALVDVVIIGGGPAGTAAARMLSGKGWSVLLLTREPTPDRELAESLPPSSRKIFEALGFEGRIAEAGFLESTGNSVVWGSSTFQARPFSDGRGWQVERGRLARTLLEGASEAGADVRTNATVRRVDLPERTRAEGGGPARVHYELRGKEGDPNHPPLTVQATFVLDASGRAGVLASGGFRDPGEHPPTTALVGVWEAVGSWGIEDPTHTLVESYRDGWAWSVPVDRTRRYFTAMVDPEITELQREHGLEALYLRELAKTGATARLLVRGRLTGRPSAWGATPYGAHRFQGPGFLLLGDAAAFLDPLSSFGVKKALASGWLGAVAVHTALLDPSREALAMDFFERRERAAAESFHTQTRAFYELAGQAHSHPFWTRRSAPDLAGPSSAGRGGRKAGDDAAPFDDRPLPHTDEALSGAPDVRRLREEAKVLTAFAELRSASSVRLQAAPELAWTEGPAVREEVVVLEPKLALPSFPEGLRYLREVDVVRLLELVREPVARKPRGGGAGAHANGWDVPSLHTAYARSDRSIPLPDFLGALSVLLAEGALLNAPASGEEEVRCSEAPRSMVEGGLGR